MIFDRFENGNELRYRGLTSFPREAGTNSFRPRRIRFNDRENDNQDQTRKTPPLGSKLRAQLPRTGAVIRLHTSSSFLSLPSKFPACPSQYRFPFLASFHLHTIFRITVRSPTIDFLQDAILHTISFDTLYFWESLCFPSYFLSIHTMKPFIFHWKYLPSVISYDFTDLIKANISKGLLWESLICIFVKYSTIDCII